MTDSQERRRLYRLLADYTSIIFIVPSAVVGGYLVGDWLDGKLESRPWCTMAAVLLGSAGGFVEVFRILMRRR
jgi:F0F1-type ATP synthase assembly protein I